MQRRTFFGVLGAGALGSVFHARLARATLVRGLSLEELAQSSQHILRGRALDSSSQWATVGGRRRIVTDTRVRVEDVLAKDAPKDTEIMVRTLGGTVGDVGALVHGEAELLLDESCVVFLRELPSGLQRVVGMAQGHYPVALDVHRIPRLNLSPRASDMVGGNQGAIRRLVGREISEARTLIREALRR